MYRFMGWSFSSCIVNEGQRIGDCGTQFGLCVCQLFIPAHALVQWILLCMSTLNCIGLYFLLVAHFDFWDFLGRFRVCGLGILELYVFLMTGRFLQFLRDSLIVDLTMFEPLVFPVRFFFDA